MLPIIWKVVIKNYLKVFFLCNLLFASVLVLVRMYEIARFATLGGGFFNLLLFTSLQFPFILPLAIPISCAIATTILVQKMCNSCELTSLRAFGFSIYSIFKPLFALSIIFSAFNFYLVFAVTPSIKQACKNLMIKVTTENPLAMLKNGKISVIQDGYLNLKIKNNSEKIEDLFFAFKNTDTNQIAIIFADELNIKNYKLNGKKVDYIYYEPITKKLPILILEHFQKISQPCDIIPYLMFKNKDKKFVLQRLSLNSLLTIIQDESISNRKKNQCLFEIIRRLYLSLGPFILTLVGLSWSIDIGRRSSFRYKAILFSLIFFYFITYLLSKNLKNNFLMASFIFTAAISFIFYWSKRHIFKIERGYETCL